MGRGRQQQRQTVPNQILTLGALAGAPQPAYPKRRNMLPEEVRALWDQNQQGMEQQLLPVNLWDLAVNNPVSQYLGEVIGKGAEKVSEYLPENWREQAMLTLPLLVGTALAKEPWQIRKGELVPHKATLPKSKSLAELAGISPDDYSEAALNARALRARAAETIPPDITHHDVGSWGIDSTGELMQLREYDLDDPKLIFTENPFRNQTVQKYEDWIQQGHQPPPLSAVETEKGSIKVSEGHHRAAAIRNTGGKKAKVWVSVTHNRPIGPDVFMPEGVTHRKAIERALEAGKDVPYEVLLEYTDLLPKK